MFQAQNNYKSFKELNSLEQRQMKFQQKLSLHPEMIPVILEKHSRSKMPQLNKPLYMNLPKGFRIIQFRDTLKNTLQISSKQSLYFHIGNQLLPEDANLIDIYEKKKDAEDGFLYITYSDLEVFG